MMLEQTPEMPQIQAQVRYTAPVAPAPVPAVPQAPVVQAMPVANEKANIIEFDPELKEKLIATAHENEKNFLIYCGLFDARPFERENNLILDMESPLAYDILRQDRNSAVIAEIFNNYSSVILKFASSESLCRTFNNQTEETPRNFVPEIKNSEYLPEIHLNESEAQTEKSEKISPRQSPFDKIRNELVKLQTKPEIILISHNENEDEDSESENENNTLESESDNESEGED